MNILTHYTEVYVKEFFLSYSEGWKWSIPRYLTTKFYKIMTECFPIKISIRNIEVFLLVIPSTWFCQASQDFVNWSIKCYKMLLTVTSICTSVISNKVEHLYSFIEHIFVLFWKMTANVFSHFLLKSLSFPKIKFFFKN